MSVGKNCWRAGVGFPTPTCSVTSRCANYCTHISGGQPPVPRSPVAYHRRRGYVRCGSGVARVSCSNSSLFATTFCVVLQPITTCSCTPPQHGNFSVIRAPCVCREVDDGIVTSPHSMSSAGKSRWPVGSHSRSGRCFVLCVIHTYYPRLWCVAFACPV